MSELKKKAIHGIKWTTLSSLITAVGGLAQTMILARLLNASDFGQMAIVNVIAGFSVHLIDMGFSNAIIRESDVTQRQLSTLFWINVIAGAVLTAMIWLISDSVASFYHMDDLGALLKFISPAFVISGLGVQNFSLMQKQLRFRQLAISESIPFILSFVVVVYFAWTGHGVFALAYGVVLRALSSTLLSTLLSGKASASYSHFAFAETRNFLAFGSVQVVEKMLSYFNMNIDTLLIGKFLGKDALGAYEIAKRLLIQPLYIINPLIGKVTFPIISMVKEDNERIKNITLRALELVLFINGPIYLASLAGAPLLIETLFGEKWLIATDAFRWLSVIYLVRALANPFGSIILARVGIREILLFQLGSSLVLVIALTAGAALGNFYFYLFFMLFTFAFFWGSIRLQVQKVVSINMLFVLKKIIPDILIMLCVCAVIYPLIAWVPVAPVFRLALYGFGIAAVLLLLYLKMLNRPVVNEILETIKKI